MLRGRVFALLRLSEAVCDRAGLVRYSVGTTNPRFKVSAVDRYENSLFEQTCEATARLQKRGKRPGWTWVRTGGTLPGSRRGASGPRPQRRTGPGIGGMLRTVGRKTGISFDARDFRQWWF